MVTRRVPVMLAWPSAAGSRVVPARAGGLRLELDSGVEGTVGDGGVAEHEPAVVVAFDSVLAVTERVWTSGEVIWPTCR